MHIGCHQGRTEVLAWTHRWILPTSEKTLANWPLSEQLGLTIPLPALMLSKDRSRHRLQARMASEDLLHADTRQRAASDLTGPVYPYNPSGTSVTQEGLPTKLLWVSSLARRTWDKPVCGKQRPLPLSPQGQRAKPRLGTFAGPWIHSPTLPDKVLKA